jgi:curved DNA-binding protein
MPVQFKDYYETLGVSKTASEDEIRKAFRSLARKYHPDMVKAKEKAGAEVKFKEINEAYEVLSNPEKRKKYDTLGADWERQGPPPPHHAGGRPFSHGPGGSGGFQGAEEFHFGGTGFSDFFEQFFSGASRRRSGGFAPDREEAMAPNRGQDIEADLLVSIEEAFHGATRQVSFRRSNTDTVHTYDVRIPAGVREGQKIRLAGQGSPAPTRRGGSPGDLLLRVKFAKHPDFQVEGADLHYELTLAAWQAVLGYETTVPSLEGSVRMKIPPGTQPGQKFRLKQRGLPKGNSQRGDLYVIAEVELPRQLTVEQRELWEKLAKA